MEEIRVPDIGDYKDVSVISILVAPGTSVAEGEPIIVLESDKAAMEVPSPARGEVARILVKAGDRLSQGDVILTLTRSDSDVARVSPTASPSSAAIEPLLASPDTKPATSAGVPTPASNIAYAGPAVRKLARELGIDLAQISASGAHGRILREDLLAFVRTSRAPASAPAQAAPSTPNMAFGVVIPDWPEPDHAKFGRVEPIELSRIQKLSAGNLARNWVTIPHVTNFDKTDVTETEAFRQILNKKAGEGVKVTMLAFLIKAAVSALKAYPRFNVSFSKGGVVQKHYYNIGFAADTPNGLVVAVIQNCDGKGVMQIATEARDLAEKARKGTLTSREMSGGCFTVSSLGGIGGTGFTPIINAPEVAILGAARAEMQPVWDGKTFVPRLTLPLSLSWDHRAVDGAMAARFLAHIADGLRDARNLAL